MYISFQRKKKGEVSRKEKDGGKMTSLRLQALLRTPAIIKSRKKDMGSHRNMGSVLQLPQESRKTPGSIQSGNLHLLSFPLYFALSESSILTKNQASFICRVEKEVLHCLLVKGEKHTEPNKIGFSWRNIDCNGAEILSGNELRRIPNQDVSFIITYARGQGFHSSLHW